VLVLVVAMLGVFSQISHAIDIPATQGAWLELGTDDGAVIQTRYTCAPDVCPEPTWTLDEAADAVAGGDLTIESPGVVTYFIRSGVQTGEGTSTVTAFVDGAIRSLTFPVAVVKAPPGEAHGASKRILKQRVEGGGLVVIVRSIAP